MSWLDGLVASLRPGTAQPAPATLHADARAAVPVPLAVVPIRPPPADRSVRRAVRNNNPGNLRPAEHPYPGQVAIERDPAMGDYAVFASETDGWRELGALALRHWHRGATTIRALIGIWAPPSDNNPTEAYIAAVCKQVGCGPDTPVNLTGWVVMLPLAREIGQVEAGSWKWWHESAFRAGLRQLGLSGQEPA